MRAATGVGLSTLVRRFDEPMGVAVVDLRAGQMTTLLQFQTAVEEIFDVQLLHALCFPEVIGFQKIVVADAGSMRSRRSRAVINWWKQAACFSRTSASPIMPCPI